MLNSYLSWAMDTLNKPEMKRKAESNISWFIFVIWGGKIINNS